MKYSCPTVAPSLLNILIRQRLVQNDVCDAFSLVVGLLVTDEDAAPRDSASNVYQSKEMATGSRDKLEPEEKRRRVKLGSKRTGRAKVKDKVKAGKTAKAKAETKETAKPEVNMLLTTTAKAILQKATKNPGNNMHAILKAVPTAKSAKAKATAKDQQRQRGHRPRWRTCSQCSSPNL